MNWSYMVLVICVILAAFAVILEYRRVNKQRLSLRIVASLITIMAMAALTLPVNYWTETKTNQNEAILLTTGYNKDSLSNYKNHPQYTIDSVINAERPIVKRITIDQLHTLIPAIAKVHVFGFGLADYDLMQLDSVPIVYHASPYPFGITSVSWPEKINQGQQFVVQGIFNNTLHKQVKLVLTELNTNADSILIAPVESSHFELRCSPKTIGKMMNHLMAIAGNDTLENEKLALEIMPFRPLNVLILSGSPNFENKFLKNWLADKGFGVAIRSAISKNKFSSEVINMEQLPIGRLSSRVLSKFDVLISDYSVLTELNNNENDLIKNEVLKNAMGLIVRVDTILKTKSWFQNGFSFYKDSPVSKSASTLSFRGEKKISKILFNGEMFIRNNNMQPLVSDAKQRQLAGVERMAIGKIVFTTIENTYNWTLTGNKNDYSAFWSLLIGEAAKEEQQQPILKTVNLINTLNQPTLLSTTIGLTPTPLRADDVNTAAIQNINLPFQWQSLWWPVKTGWQVIKYQGGSTNWLYVYNHTDWKSVKEVEQITATKKYELAIKGRIVTKPLQKNMAIAVPKIYFYCLLLICCSFLWFERKIPAKQVAKASSFIKN